MRPQAIATFALVALVYPLFEGMAWNGNFGLQNGSKANLAPAFTILPAQWWFMPWAAGLR